MNRPFAFNPGSSSIAGCETVGNVSAGNPTSGFSSTGLTWWGGPEETNNYFVVFGGTSTQRAGRNGATANLFCRKSSSFTDNSFIEMANNIGATTFASVSAAKTWLNTNGYWTNHLGGVVTAGLVSRLDASINTSYSGSGNSWNDLSGNGNNGTLFNSPPFISSNGGSISFDGVDDYCNIPLPNVQSYNTITICGFIKWNEFNQGMFLGMSTYDVWTFGNCLGYNNGASNVIGINAATVTSLGLLGNWKHYTFVMNKTGLLSINKIYINGTTVGALAAVQQSDGNIPGFSTNLSLCSWNAGGFNGKMQYGDIMVYNRELTPAEIIQNYNATKTRFGY